MVSAAWQFQAAIFASWNDRRRETLALAGALTLVIVAAGGVVIYFLRALRRRERHYRALFNNAAFGVLLLEGEHFVDCNARSATMFGARDHGTLKGLRPRDVAPPTQPHGRSFRGKHAREASRSAPEGYGIIRMDLQAAWTPAKPLIAEVDLTGLEARPTDPYPGRVPRHHPAQAAGRGTRGDADGVAAARRHAGATSGRRTPTHWP